ncbi:MULTISPECIES: DUF5606 family protein [unclassified Carboxylicivirga]|uniref:DUF5606 family protein n=1 Tax=Carboxylicivirga TaxID=1628153 RepID=UPI003D33154D
MLKGILAISGQRGLFKLVSQAKNSIIVESLIDGKKMPAYATSRISALEDISIYTEDEDVKLFDVFKAIHEKENGGMAISPKSSGAELKTYFEEVLPLYDKDRVYVSDIKKVLGWYNLLMEKDMFDPNAVEEEVEVEASEE